MKLSRIGFLFIGIVTMVLSMACSDDSKSAAPTSIPVSSDGGTLTFPNGVSVNVPAGAIDGDVEIKAELLKQTDEGVMPLFGKVYSIVQFSPSGAEFNEPIEITVPLDFSTTDDKLTVVWWNEQDTTWTVVDYADVKGSKATFYVSHFSTYAVIAEQIANIFVTFYKYANGLAEPSTEGLDATALETDGELSEACSGIIKYMDKDLGFGNLSMPQYLPKFHAHTCVHITSYTARYMNSYANSTESNQSHIEKQGISHYGPYKYTDEYILNLSSRYMSDRMKKTTFEATGETETTKESSQKPYDMLIGLSYDPCEAELTGSVASASIKEGEETQVTLQTLCGGDPLEGQSLQILTTEELSTKNDVAFLETDDEGTAVLTVKGEKAGAGNVNVTTINKVNDSLITETDVAVDVGDLERWRLTFEIHESVGDDTNYVKFGYSMEFDIQLTESVANSQLNTKKITGVVSVTNLQDEFHYAGPAYEWIPENDCVSYSQTKWEASPTFNDLKDIPVTGSYVAGNGIKYIMDLHVENTSLPTVFFSPNLKSTYSTKFIDNSTLICSEDLYEDYLKSGSLLIGSVADSEKWEGSLDYPSITDVDGDFKLQAEFSLDNMQFTTIDLSEGDASDSNYDMESENTILAPFNLWDYPDYLGSHTATKTLTIERLDK